MCVAECRQKAIELLHNQDDQISSEIEGAITTDQYNPGIVPPALHESAYQVMRDPDFTPSLPSRFYIRNLNAGLSIPKTKEDTFTTPH